MNNLDNIRSELAGKTGMEPEHEEDLFQRISDIEQKDGLVAPLKKADWILVFVFLIFFGFAPLLWYAIKLF